MRRVMITGATGAIGRALITECLQQKTEVYILCNPDSLRSRELFEMPQIHCFPCPLCEIDKWNKLDLEFDVFYHLAWQGTTGGDRNNVILQEKNIKYSLDAVDLAHRLGCHTFIGAGSQAEYGRKDCRLTPELSCYPENGYGIAKLSTGYLTKLHAYQLGMNHVWVRILSIYGPYDQQGSMVMTCINKFLDGEVPQLTKCEQKWDYLYSKDAAKALYLLGEYRADGIYCLGSGYARRLKEYVECIRKIVNSSAKVDMGAIPYTNNQIMYLCADIERLTNDTGFVPKYSFEQGIKETVEWMKGIKGKR